MAIFPRFLPLAKIYYKDKTKYCACGREYMRKIVVFNLLPKESPSLQGGEELGGPVR